MQPLKGHSVLAVIECFIVSRGPYILKARMRVKSRDQIELYVEAHTIFQVPAHGGL